MLCAVTSGNGCELAFLIGEVKVLHSGAACIDDCINFRSGRFFYYYIPSYLYTYSRTNWPSSGKIISDGTLVFVIGYATFVRTIRIHVNYLACLSDRRKVDDGQWAGLDVHLQEAEFITTPAWKHKCFFLFPIIYL